MNSQNAHLLQIDDPDNVPVMLLQWTKKESEES
jgi:hypothetical protein